MATHFVTVKSLESYPTSKWKARTETDQTDTVQASKEVADLTCLVILLLK